jgi:hypothetical protein
MHRFSQINNSNSLNIFSWVLTKRVDVCKKCVGIYINNQIKRSKISLKNLFLNQSLSGIFFSLSLNLIVNIKTLQPELNLFFLCLILISWHQFCSGFHDPKITNPPRQRTTMPKFKTKNYIFFFYLTAINFIKRTM